jgi:hypothetical protein
MENLFLLQINIQFTHIDLKHWIQQKYYVKKIAFIFANI